MDQPVEPTWNRDDFTNVASALSWQAHRQPNAVAIHYPRSRLFRKPTYQSCTYRDLDDLSNAYARGLTAYGIGPGVRTALMVTPGLDFFARTRQLSFPDNRAGRPSRRVKGGR